VALHPGVRAAVAAALRHQGAGSAAVAAWIEDYNTRRRHSACQKLPSAAFEQLLAERGKEAA